MRKPNLLVMVTHDTGRHLGCYGVPTVHTETLDAWAADGVRLTHLFAPSPVCSPSRGALLTGQYPQRNGLIGLAGLLFDPVTRQDLPVLLMAFALAAAAAFFSPRAWPSGR